MGGLFQIRTFTSLSGLIIGRVRRFHGIRFGFSIHTHLILRNLFPLFGLTKIYCDILLFFLGRNDRHLRLEPLLRRANISPLDLLIMIFIPRLRSAHPFNSTKSHISGLSLLGYLLIHFHCIPIVPPIEKFAEVRSRPKSSPCQGHELVRQLLSISSNFS
jgi:hypothetical protein